MVGAATPTTERKRYRHMTLEKIHELGLINDDTEVWVRDQTCIW